MTREITQSVGHGGVNVIIDVMIVQELLNGIQEDQGGPSQDFVVDGIPTRELVLAIHHFQLHHFGWSGADGRVDPGHQTIRKLNELQSGPPTTTTFLISRPPHASPELDPSRPQDWFFMIQLVRPGVIREAVFWFGQPNWAPRVLPARQGFRTQTSTFLRAATPMAMADLEGPATFEQIISSWHSTYDAELRSRPPHPFKYNGTINGKLKIDHPKVKAMPVGSATFYLYEGHFQRVG